MNMETIDACVQAVRYAYNQGIISVRENQVHLTQPVFEELLLEVGAKPTIVSRASKYYPFEVSFIHMDITYYSLYSAEEMTNKIGGFIDELIASN
ncbi:hypothetical protein [Bacillus pseudomycoides]|uniref:Uncharacterized protein n=1 Tax=Bacillus pseudomycoides TaxID=64104 RepID=A0A2A8BZP0_9BACI|nr:hypothetical protein [Bacillus pseudomycoides]PEA80790.1 hypothetical protein CON99_26360 [Bacillus pseudomycoides]PED70454.1 hypothetical protein CON97_19560 [Bacillus pseudomycoides]PEI33533.1 hypothetical protein CN620_27305 [Bacillus pseudomycoides]PEJ71213.1 hypothetical protein CN680_22965 [Bacillus pseudomycoides]PEM15835.1 hypothetical protein CN628_15385 [Bacillus pseudomycoides]